jgi:hypothetical protein
MRRLGDGLTLLLTTVLGMAGCASADITLKPPKHPEEIAVPPLEEARFSSPPKYPEGTLNQNDPSKSSNGPGGPGGVPNMSAMNSMNSMSGRGGPGAGYAGPGGGMGGRGY